MPGTDPTGKMMPNKAKSSRLNFGRCSAVRVLFLSLSVGGSDMQVELPFFFHWDNGLPGMGME